MPLTKKDLVDRLANECQLTKRAANDVLNSIGNIVLSETAKDGFVLPGIGRFTAPHRAARVGRNPLTGEKLKIAAKRVVRFSATKAFKTAVNTKKKATKKG